MRSCLSSIHPLQELVHIHTLLSVAFGVLLNSNLNWLSVHSTLVVRNRARIFKAHRHLSNLAKFVMKLEVHLLNVLMMAATERTIPIVQEKTSSFT
jgi:hypothetical protein